MKRLAFVVLIFVGLLTACFAPPPKPVATIGKFDAAEVTYIHEAGTNTIQGQAFMRQRGGGIVTCASEEVYLFPRGAYAEERMRNIYGTADRPAMAVSKPDAPDAEYVANRRVTHCDASGSFGFSAIADGDYFIITRVVWETPTGYQGAMQWQGGPVMSPVRVGGEETVSVIIAP